MAPALYDPRYDLNYDGIINALDARLAEIRRRSDLQLGIALNFGASINCRFWDSIGSLATYTPVGLTLNGFVLPDWPIGFDKAFINYDSQGNPSKLMTSPNPGAWGAGFHTYTPPSWNHAGQYNGCWSGFDIDNTLFREGQPITVAPGGAPACLYPANGGAGVAPGGDFTRGSHGGSGLSTFGSLRAGWSTFGIRHALGINLPANETLDHTAGGGSGHVAPAFQADAAYNTPGAADYYGADGLAGQYSSPYGGPSGICMGTRLGLPPSVDVSTIVTNPIQQMFVWVCRYKGLIVCDNSDAYRYDLHADVNAELPNAADLAVWQQVLRLCQIVS